MARFPASPIPTPAKVFAGVTVKSFYNALVATQTGAPPIPVTEWRPESYRFTRAELIAALSITEPVMPSESERRAFNTILADAVRRGWLASAGHGYRFTESGIAIYRATAS